MPKRIVKSSVMVQRGGKLVYPQVGQPFDFTDAELKSINAGNPKALEKIILADEPAAVKHMPDDPPVKAEMPAKTKAA
jgi:hypothetical protein